MRFQSDPVALDTSRSVVVSVEDGHTEYQIARTDSRMEGGLNTITVTARELQEAASKALPQGVASWRERNTEANLPQALVMALMRGGSFNGFNGNKVADALLAHRHLWSAAFFTSPASVGSEDAAYQGIISIRQLQELAEGEWFGDTLFLLTPPTNDNAEHEALEKLMTELGADEVDWIDGPRYSKHEMGRQARRELKAGQGLLRVWWD